MTKTSIKIVLISAAVLFVCSLVALAVGIFIPAEKTKEVTLANYNHQGNFSYQGYSAAQSAQVNNILFTQLIEEIEITFLSQGISEKTTIRLILGDKSSNWEREISSMTADSLPVSLPLDLKEIMLRGASFNSQLKGEKLGEITEDLKKKLLQQNSNFFLKIIAEAGQGDDFFTMTLEGELNSSTLKWKEASFNKIERGFPGKGGDNWRQASFGYKAKLKENDLLPLILERKPELLQTSFFSPDLSLFTAMVKSLDINFDYQFKSDVPINSLEEQVSVWLVTEETGRWKKSFILLPATKKDGQISLKFPFDINKLKAIAEEMDKEIGSKGKGQEVTIFAQVHTIAQTRAGIIDETFDQQIKMKIGETLDLGSDKISVLSKPGKITKKVTERNSLALTLRILSLNFLGISLSIFSLFTLLYYKRNRSPSLLDEKEEEEKNRQKYKDLISEIDNFPLAQEAETIFIVSSLADLIKISNNLLKPVLLKTDQNCYTYWVADGLIRYQYVKIFSKKE